MDCYLHVLPSPTESLTIVLPTSQLSTAVQMVRSLSLNNQRKKKMAVFTAQMFLHATTPAKTHNNDVNNTTIFCKDGHLKDTLQVLQSAECCRDSYSAIYMSMLQACIQKKALSEVKLIHAHINKSVFMVDPLLENTLLYVYVKCGSVVDARKVFDRMPQQDVRAWTAMITAYGRHESFEKALSLFHQMQQIDVHPNQFTYTSVVSACAARGSLKQGVEIHGAIIRSGFQSDVTVMNALVDMYAKCGRIKKARCLFDRMPQRDVISWTAMISAYTQHRVDEALELFHQMQQTSVQPNQFTFSTVLSACANLLFLDKGVEIHQEIIKRGFQSDNIVANALVDMYAKCGNLKTAERLFLRMSTPGVVSCTAMIAGYAQNGLVDEAMLLFKNMPQKNVVSWNAMIAGLAQNGMLSEAFKLFEEMPQRDVVSWTTMMAGYAQNGKGEEALKLFKRMQFTDVRPDSTTFASVLPACADMAALEHGREIHEKVIRSGFLSDIVVTNALIDMYAKCGNIEKARGVFDRIKKADDVSWTTVIAGYAIHGCAKEALQLFEQMKQSGIKPSHTTLVFVLSACSHAGLLQEGYQYFNCMIEIYHIKPAMVHYSCMVDLLGRAGCLNEAHDIIKQMPIKPDAAVWNCLLSACRIHNNLELGEYVAERMFELDPKSAAPYIMLSNIYAAARRWSDIEKIRKKMKDRHVEKIPGCSWIEVNKSAHAFLTGDTRSP